MNKITSLEDYKNQKKEVRVLRDTYAQNSSAKQMIGGTFEVRAEYYYDKTISVFNTSSVYGEKYAFNEMFNESDVQFLTPIFYKGYRIGVGDIIKISGDWYEVFDYTWRSNKWMLKTALDKDYSRCGAIEEYEIEDVKPPYQQNEIEVNIVGENKTVKISRKSAIALNLIEE